MPLLQIKILGILKVTFELLINKQYINIIVRLKPQNYA